MSNNFEIHVVGLFESKLKSLQSVLAILQLYFENHFTFFIFSSPKVSQFSVMTPNML